MRTKNMKKKKKQKKTMEEEEVEICTADTVCINLQH